MSLPDQPTNRCSDRVRQPFICALKCSALGIVIVAALALWRDLAPAYMYIGWTAAISVAFAGSYLGSVIGIGKATKLIGFTLLVAFLLAMLGWIISNGGLVVRR